MDDEIRNMIVIVDVVAKKAKTQLEAGNDTLLRELIWNVPLNILAKHAREEG